MQILLVEDEISLSNAIKRILEQQGYFVDAVYDGLTAVEYAGSANYKLIILDIMIPGIDGFEVVRTLRREDNGTPILVLSARTSKHDKLSGLNCGADDYMTKPFDTDELLARVGALTRRTGGVIMNKIDHADLSLDLNSALLRCGDNSVQLSHKEFEVLKVFLYDPQTTISTEAIIANVWGIESDASYNNVEVYISINKKKLRYLGSKVNIKKIQRLGYRLEVS